MTKKITIIISMFFLTLLVGYYINNNSNSKNTGGNIEKKDKNIIKKDAVVYSNLVDNASQEEVENVLKKVHINEDSIKNFFENVNDFNKTIEDKGLVKNGFIKLNKPKYDIVKNTELLEKKYPAFLGNNCRITSFSLIKDLIEVKNPIYNKKSTNLAFDINSLENTPNPFLSDKEKLEFRSFFDSIETPITKDLKIHLKNVQDDWKKKKVKFLKKDKVSLISVFMHTIITEDESYLSIGHIGILIPINNTKLLFIEKLSYQEPYQAIKFNNKQELVDYLMSKYDIEHGQPSARPFILENDQLIEGFRYNPENNEKIKKNK